jgi:hypothetical protein
VEALGRMIADAIERMSSEQKAALRENLLRSARERLGLVPSERDKQWLKSIGVSWEELNDADN